MKIYIIEDDAILRSELSKMLSNYGYDCSFDDDYENIIPLALQSNADLILLDINLPVFDGFYVCRQLRQKSSVPIIIVTSRNSDMDELMSMNLGADDFITKPYNPQILVSRIAAVLKRNNGANQSSEQYKGLTFYAEKGILAYLGQQVELTKNEMKIFSVLLRNKGKIVSRDEIINELWQADEFVDDNTLTVNMNRLRKKIEKLGIQDFITTKRGIGYMI